jgi:hypothetical protein
MREEAHRARAELSRLDEILRDAMDTLQTSFAGLARDVSAMRFAPSAVADQGAAEATPERGVERRINAALRALQF